MSAKGALPAIIEQGFAAPKKIASTRNAVAFEAALSLTGFGKYQWGLLLACGFAYLASGYQNGLSAYVIPAAQCDLRMTSQDKGLLNAVFLIGGIASAFFWGILADHIGRRSILVATLFLDGFVTFISSFSQTFTVLAVFRFLNGFIVGAPGSIICTYLGEFIGARHRARCVCAMGFFFTLSWLLLPLVAMGVLPIEWKIQTDHFLFNSWRLFILLASFPAVLSAVLIAVCFPESPKYLYSKGREEEALSVMKSMYEFNYQSAKGPYPVEIILPDSTEGAPSRRSTIQDPTELAQMSKSLNGKTMEVILSSVWRQIISLFRPPNSAATVLGATLMFANMFGYYGFGLWLPELFDRFEEHYKNSNESVSVCELTRIIDTPIVFSNQSQSYPTTTSEEFCRNTKVDFAVYMNTFIIGIVCLVGNVLCSLFASQLGLKFLTVFTMLVSGVSAIVIYFLNTSLDNLIASCVFLSFVGAANIVITSAVCDLFPTRIRALAVCAAMFAGRLGAVVSNLILGYVLDTACEVPVFLMAGALLFGAFLGIFLPGRFLNRVSPKT